MSDNQVNFHVIRSSAGAGKTYSLIQTILLYILKNPDPRYYRHILAITFTNKATNEMKERLIQALDDLSLDSPPDPTLLNYLSERVDLSEEEIKLKCSLVLKMIIHDYGEMGISTIDRFVYRIIRSFSFELDVPSHVEIELKKDRLQRSVVDSIFEEVNTNEELGRILIEFSEHKFRDEKNPNLDTSLMQLTDQVMNPESENILKTLKDLNEEDFLSIRRNIQTFLSKLESEIRTKAKGIYKLFKDHTIDASEVANGKNGVFGFIRKIVESDQLAKPSSNVLKVLDTGNWKSGKCSSATAHVLDANAQELTTKLKEITDILDKEYVNYIFAKLLNTNLYSMALAHRAFEILRRIKTEYSTAQLEDFNQLISKLVKNTPIPFIYERIGEKYHHYLLDEFQDTSEVQWYNLAPLIENSLSEGFDSLVVGDAKQAIYRFRGGSAKQLNRLPQMQFKELNDEFLQSRIHVFDSAYKPDNLQFNYRSSKTIVHFVNAFFEKLKNLYPKELSEVYTNHYQKVKKTELVGSVDIKFLEESDDEDRLQHTTNAIRLYLDAGYKYGDIVIICRKKKQCTKVADYLVKNEIPVVSSESLELRSSEKVKHLIYWLQLIYQGGGMAPAFKILEHLVKKDGAKMNNDQLFQQFKHIGDFKRLIGELGFKIQWNALTSLNLFELISSLLSIFEPESRSDAFVITFLDHVNEFQNKYGNNAIDFLNQWFDQHEDLSIELPDVPDAVRIMTAHKSKGLEFRIVIAPFLFSSPGKSDKMLWVQTLGKDRELAPAAWLPCQKTLEDTRYHEYLLEENEETFLDTVNLMYVVMTRAREHLLILSKTPPKSKESKSEQSLLSHCLDLNDINSSESSSAFYSGQLINSEVQGDLKMNVQHVDGKFSQGNWRNSILTEFKTETGLPLDNEINSMKTGLEVHELLSKMHDVTEVHDIIESEKDKLNLTDEEVSELKTSIKKILTDSEISMYFSEFKGKIMNEREVIDASGEKHRPDRCCISEGEVVIFDYKTGEYNKDHEEQMVRYLSLFKDMGYKSTSAYLLYFTSQEIRKVA